MESYHRALEYSKSVLAVRDGLIAGTIGVGQSVLTQFDRDDDYRITGKSFYTESGTRPYILGYLSYESKGHNAAMVSHSWIDFHQNTSTGIILDNYTSTSFTINPDYDEGQYFQDSLLYTDKQLFFIVLTNWLAQNPMKDYQNFKFYFRGRGRTGILARHTEGYTNVI